MSNINKKLPQWQDKEFPGNQTKKSISFLPKKDLYAALTIALKKLNKTVVGVELKNINMKNYTSC